MTKFTFLITLFFCIYSLVGYAQKQTQELDSYNIIWDSQSKNSSESMPCGGGSIGLNVWVENNELLFYIAKSDAFDENNGLNKLGRVRISITPNPFEGANFRQELKLNDGYINISATKRNEKTEIKLWVDVFRPVIRVEMSSTIDRTFKAAYESWRYKTFKLRKGEDFQNSYKFAPFDSIYTYSDSLQFDGSNVLFYHRNRDYTIFDANVKLQGLEAIKDKLYNPIMRNTFGGVMYGEKMIPAGNTSGQYMDTDYEGWALQTEKPGRRQNLEITLHTGQTETIDEWQDELRRVVADSKKNANRAHQRNIEWWHSFWGRSHIFINPTNVDPRDTAWQVGRNYQLFRYMLGCNAFGSSPTKFNGGLFTYDPVFVDENKPFTPDFRNWCGGTMTAQNQRLVYFPMLKSGDFDLMKPQFDFYMRMLRNVELRSEYVWGHTGAGFTEQIESYGLSNPAEYGWDRPAGFDKGTDYNAWLEHLWDTSLEFCFMMLETNRYANEDISEYIPFIESCITFYDEHYRMLARKRGIRELDENGKLILYPTSGCESFKMAYNSVTTITGLKTILTQLLALPQNYLTEEKRAKFAEMLTRIPDIPFTQYDGHRTIAPALVYQRTQGNEIPQLYPVFPWGIYCVGKEGLDIALNTWNFDPLVAKSKSHVGWRQENIWAARLGLVEEARDLCAKKMKDCERRFPAFWGPGFDWTPDHNWGGSGMIGLQEMLLQTTDDKIYLLPAWPKDWDVDFKLFAPKNTIVECSFKNGKVERLIITPFKRARDVVFNL